MRNIDEDTITQAVVASFSRCNDSRLRKVMTSLVQHLHTFVREVSLTEDEWDEAIRFLTKAGHITDDKRQEFILLSDVLGLSMLVTSMATRKPKECTESTVFGPFYVENAPEYKDGDDIAQGAPGIPCWVSGRITDIDGNAISSAAVNVWQSDGDGLYDVQDRNFTEHRVRGKLKSMSDGTFNFKSVLAVPYAIPHDGPVGRLLAATGRRPWRPAHLHFMIDAPDFERLITHVFRRDDEHLESDAVFGVRESLIADWVRHAPGAAPDGRECPVSFYTLNFNFVLNRK